MRTEIMYEDDAVLVVYKPAGLAAQTSSVGRQDVVSELKNYLRQTEVRTGKNVRSVPYLGVIHRLDQPVEGLLVFAKNPKAASCLSAQLQKQEEEAGFCKHYYAVLYGCPVKTNGAMEDYLCKKDGRAEIVECRSERQDIHSHVVAERAGRDRKAEEAEMVPVVSEKGNGTGGEVCQLRKEQQAEHDHCRNEDRTIIKKKHPGKLTHPDARKARLRYCILQTADASETALADIWSETGRLRQSSDLRTHETIDRLNIRSETERLCQSSTRMAPEGTARLDIQPETGRLHHSNAHTAHDRIALADIQLETGRFHQIRAQMAHGGTPLLGDLKYGNEESIEAGRRLNVRNVALCAYRLEFTHPVTGRKMDFHIKPRGEVFSLFSQF